MIKRKLLLPLIALASAVAVLAAAPAQAWAPKKPVDFVIMAGKGGGADKMARLMQSVIEKHGFSSKPFVPINKPGGSSRATTTP
jgi:putative tricarboxylic transport membrane protein